jgi:hypothetical protein
MSRPRGGITGFGYGNTLGGLLLGGVKKADMTASQLASYEKSLEKQKAQRLAYRRLMESRGTPLKTKGTISARQVKLGSFAHARNMLKRLIDAENKGAELLLAQDHPDLAEYLDEDMAYNINLRDSGRRPKWLLDKYSGKTGRQLYPPVDTSRRLSGPQLVAAKEALKFAPVWEYTSANGKTRKAVKEGSSEFKRIMEMKSVREGTASFEPRAPFIRRDQYE